MKASAWEFKNRAMIFGMILGFSFFMYSFDQVNAAAALATWLGPRLGIDADLLTRIVFGVGALVVIKAALIRTWASSYLNSAVVYAAEVKTASLVADGPYRRLRNPLYYANVLLAIGMGLLMSRLGLALVVVAMVTFCYRLILREEADLDASQGEPYRAYRAAVPRLWFSLRPRVPSAGRQANWKAGFKAELWYWGFATAAAVFAITLSQTLFLVALGASLAWFWFWSSKPAS